MKLSYLKLFVIYFLTSSILYNAEQQTSEEQIQQLFEAISNQKTDLVAQLINSNRALANATSDENSPLHIASAINNLDIVNFLIHAGANINALDEENNTPLMIAALEGASAIVQTLVNNGARVDFIDELGDTALHMAFKGDNAERAIQTARILILAGAELEEKNIEGKTPLDYANENHPTIVSQLEPIKHTLELFRAIKNNSPKELDELLDESLSEFSSIVNVRDNSGNTLLHLAALANSKPLVQLLIDKGAQKNAGTPLGTTPLHYAAWIGAEDVIPLLLDQNVNNSLAQDSQGFVPLHLAVMREHKGSVAALLNNGDQRQVDIPTYQLVFPLHLAVMNQNYDNALAISSLLLRNGANLNVVDSQGKTPLDYAQSQHGPKFIAELTNIYQALQAEPEVQITQDAHLIKEERPIRWSVQEELDTSIPLLETITNIYTSAPESAQVEEKAKEE